jgi:hypothetical protein
MMKKITVIFIALYLVLCVQVHAGIGSTCSTPIVAVEGTNITVFDSLSYQYYQFVMPCKGKITLSTKNITSKYINVNVNTKKCSGSRVASMSGYAVTTSFYAQKGDTFSIVVNGNTFDAVAWSLTINQLENFPSGISCSLPIQASVGLNTADNSEGDQWFSYTAEENSLLEISSCGLTSYDTYVRVYSDCNAVLASSDDYCNAQSYISLSVTKGKTYLICWSNYYTNHSFNWKLTINKPNSKAMVTGYNVKDNTLGIWATTRKVVIDTINHKVTATVTKNADLSSDNINGVFELSTGASISYGTSILNQSYFYIDNVQNYLYYDENPLDKTYKVLAQDGTTSQNWAVSVTKESALLTGNRFLSFTAGGYAGVIDSMNHTIRVSIPDTSFSSLYTLFTLSSMAKAYLNGTQKNTGFYLDYSDTVVYTVQAENGTSQDWSIIVSTAKGLQCNDATIAYLGNNSGNGAYIQYFSFTPDESDYYAFTSSSYGYAKIDTNCTQSGQLASGTITQGYSLVFQATAGVTYTIYINGIYSANLIISQTTLPDCSNPVVANIGTNYGNGNGNVQYFSFTPSASGYYNFTSANSVYTSIYTGCENSGYITDGYINNSLSFKANADSTYLLYMSYLYGLSFNINYTNQIYKDITYFYVNGEESISLDTINNTITGTVGPNVDLSNLYYSTNRTNSNLTKLKLNDSTINSWGYLDFTQPVTLTIVADDGTSATYTITVTQRAANTGNDIIAFMIPGETSQAVIDPDARLIKVGVTDSLVLTSIIPRFDLSYRANAKDADGNYQYSGSTTVDFSDTVIYNIIAEDATVAKWKVIALPGQTPLSNQANITAFHFYISNELVDINQKDQAINVKVPHGTDLLNDTAYFTLSAQATAEILNSIQQSGVTVNDFSNPVTYTVTAQDGTTKEWTVTATIAKNTAAEITAFKINGQRISTIDADAHTIRIIMPKGTSVTNLVSSYSVSYGAIVTVGGVQQVSSMTANDFTTPITYTVTAEDGSTVQNWIVTVVVSTYNSVDEFAQDIDIKIFPNPNNGAFNLTVNSTKPRRVTIEMATIEGKNIYSDKLDVDNSSTKEINLNVPGGIYILVVKSEDSVNRQYIQVIH